LGLLKGSKFVEVNRSDLVGQYLGHTAKKATDVVESALDGVLFIDEAYALVNGETDSFGLESVNTLIPLMENYRNRLVVIMAGYSREMRQFMNANSGLSSRIAYKIEFPDYSGAEMQQIFLELCRKNRWICSEEVSAHLQEVFDTIYKNRKCDFANGRDVRNLYEAMIRRLKSRIVKEKLTGEAIRTLIVEDIPSEYLHQKEHMNAQETTFFNL
jgi:SpoVK/Ycf46/Vps4 family AAA+-type ATPase